MSLVVYNKSTGAPKMIYEEETELIEFGSVLLTIPDGKIITKIDPDTQEPIYEDAPLTLEERLAALESSQEDQDEAIQSLAGGE